MLLTGGQGEYKPRASVPVHGLADKAAGHVPDVLLLGGEHAETGPTEGLGNPEALSFAARNISTAIPRSFKNSVGQRFAEGCNEECFIVGVDPVTHRLQIFDAAKKVGGQSKYFSGIQIEMTLKAVSPSTADLIAQKSGDLYVKTQKVSGSYYDNMQASKAADALGKAVAKALINDTVAYYDRAATAGTRFDVWFRNFDDEQTYTIVDVIEAMPGFMDKNVRNESPGNFQLDVNFQGKKFDFKRYLYKGLKEQGISFKTQQAKGNRFLLFKKGSDNPYSESNMNIQ